jgi:hypothetical protein
MIFAAQRDGNQKASHCTAFKERAPPVKAPLKQRQRPSFRFLCFLASLARGLNLRMNRSHDSGFD